MKLNLRILPGLIITSLAALWLAGCSGGSQPQPVVIEAPAGTYRIDPTHAQVAFSIRHLGLSNYIARFTKYDVSLEFDPDNLSASSVTATIWPSSVRTDYMADYKATHPDSPFDSWNKALANDERFFNAGEYPTIEFRSTGVEQTGPGEMDITGDLTLLGKTHPVTLQAQVVGSASEHPMSGVGAIGFKATGSFERSQFGMDYLLNPPLVGDEVTLLFDGEFQQQTGAGKTETGQ